MTDLPLTPYPNSIDKQPSLFKLPALFALFMTVASIAVFVISIVFNGGFHFSEYNNFILLLLGCRIFNFLSQMLLLFFIASILFVGQDLHKITIKNILFAVVYCIICQILFYLDRKGIGILSQFIGENRSIPYILKENIFYLLRYVVNILDFIVLVVSLKISSLVFQKEREPYKLSTGAHRNLFAFLFSIIFHLPMMIIFSSLSNMILGGIYVDPDYSMSLVIAMSSIPSLVVLFILLIDFAFVFFTSRGCFTRQFDKIPLKLLFKSVGWAYLYLCIFNIVFIIAFSLIQSIFLAIFAHGRSTGGMMLILGIVALIVSIVSYIKLIRKAVRKNFT